MDVTTDPEALLANEIDGIQLVESQDDELDISDSDVCSKYREGAKIVNLAIHGVCLRELASVSYLNSI